MQELWRFLHPYIRPHFKVALFSLLLSLPLSAIKGTQVWLVKQIVDSLSSSTSFTQAGLTALALVGLALLNYPCRYYHFYLMRYVVDKISCALRSEMYQKVQNLPLSFFNEQKSGNLLSHLLNDTSMLAQSLKSFVDIIREPITAIVMLGMAFYSDWQLTLVILIVAPLFILIFTKSGKKVRGHQEQVQDYLGRMTHNCSEGVMGQKTLKAFNLQQYVVNRFDQAQDIYFKYLMKTARVEENAHPLVEFVGGLAFAGVIIFAHYRIGHGFMTTGDFFSFVTALALLMDPLRKYSQANVRMNQALAAGNRLFKLMNLREEPDQGKIEIKEFFKKLEIENVTFSYGEGDVLKDFSLTIHRGERVALVGLSGSGKSTIVNLLLRLYPLQKGTIKIDGIAIEEYSLKSLRNFFGLVTQDTFLFHDTIRENLTVGREVPTVAIEESLDVACARDFIQELPQGLETVIGDRGTRLSGGQSQRVTIARAYLQNSPILLFDEATSALDNVSEKQVQMALEKLAGTKTVLAVAHRLSTIQNYDCIVVLHEGRKVEQGTHFELMKAKNEYYNLYILGQKEHTEVV